jgi:hypothetical protein
VYNFKISFSQELWLQKVFYFLYIKGKEELYIHYVSVSTLESFSIQLCSKTFGKIETKIKKNKNTFIIIIIN